MASVPWRDALCGSEENDPDGKHFQSRFGIDQSARNEALCSIMDCPELPDFDPIVPAAWDAAFAGSPVLTFNQSWRAERQPGFSAGSVRIGWQRDAFCFDARLEDSCLFTTASQRNDILYLLGDTLEFFAGAAGSPAYVEYHYAPNGVILQLLWPQSARAITLPAAGGLQAFAIEENDSSHSVWPIPGGWRVCAKVRFGPLKRHRNAGGDRDRPPFRPLRLGRCGDTRRALINRFSAPLLLPRPPKLAARRLPNSCHARPHCRPGRHAGA